MKKRVEYHFIPDNQNTKKIKKLCIFYLPGLEGWLMRWEQDRNGKGKTIKNHWMWGSVLTERNHWKIASGCTTFILLDSFHLTTHIPFHSIITITVCYLYDFFSFSIMSSVQMIFLVCALWYVCLIFTSSRSANTIELKKITSAAGNTKSTSNSICSTLNFMKKSFFGRFTLFSVHLSWQSSSKSGWNWVSPWVQLFPKSHPKGRRRETVVHLVIVKYRNCFITTHKVPDDLSSECQFSKKFLTSLCSFC